MHRCLTWFLVPLLVGVAVGAALARGSASACRPSAVFWVVEKAAAQPDVTPADSASWPSAGQLAAGSLSLQEEGTWLDIEY